jgi:hypothetical protein
VDPARLIETQRLMEQARREIGQMLYYTHAALETTPWVGADKIDFLLDLEEIRLRVGLADTYLANQGNEYARLQWEQVHGQR